MKKKILILDDDRDLLDIMQIILADVGYEAITIEKTNDLCMLVKEFQPALIILDFGLEGMDGGLWCAKLKSDPEFAHIPVIIFTAYANKGIKGTFGCDDFIEKPFDLDDIINRINKLTQTKYQPL